MLNKHDIIKNCQIDCKCCLQAVFKSITVTAKCYLCALFTWKSTGPKDKQEARGRAFMALSGVRAAESKRDLDVYQQG